MFINFAGNTININYIINIYKSIKHIDKKEFQIITMNCNNITEVHSYIEYYNNKQDRDIRFKELYNLVNAK